MSKDCLNFVIDQDMDNSDTESEKETADSEIVENSLRDEVSKECVSQFAIQESIVPNEETSETTVIEMNHAEDNDFTGKEIFFSSLTPGAYYSNEIVKSDVDCVKRKGIYKTKGVKRGRKPLFVSNPHLLEEFRANYNAQKKTQTYSGDDLLHGRVVSKTEIGNEDKGVTTYVICQPKKPIVSKSYNAESTPKCQYNKGGDSSSRSSVIEQSPSKSHFETLDIKDIVSSGICEGKDLDSSKTKVIIKPNSDT